MCPQVALRFVLGYWTYVLLNLWRYQSHYDQEVKEGWNNRIFAISFVACDTSMMLRMYICEPQKTSSKGEWFTKLTGFGKEENMTVGDH